MDILQTILLHTMWVVHLFFQKLLSNQSILGFSLPGVQPNRINRHISMERQHVIGGAPTFGFVKVKGVTKIFVYSDKNSLPKTSSLKMTKPKRITERLKNDIIDFDVCKPSPSNRDFQEQPVHLLFNEKKSSLIDLSDIVTPIEEEMLRCLCAKGFEKNPTCIRRLNYSMKPRKACSEICIPRDIFTYVWINSCSPT